MAKNMKIESKQHHHSNPLNYFFSMFPNLELKFPGFGTNPRLNAEDGLVAEKQDTSNKHDVVKFADPKPKTPPPLKIEEDEEASKLSHPLLIFPVYALGGFIILKWVWARWKERNERPKRAASDDDQSSDEYQSPADDNE